MVVWRFSQPAIASRDGVYARSVATMSRMAAASRAQRFSMNRGAKPHRRGPSVRLRWTPPHSRGGVSGQLIAPDSSVSWASRSGTGRLLDPGLEPGQRPRESRLHRAFRDAQGGGRFLAAQLQEVAACDDEAVLVAQRIDHREEPAPLIRRDGDRLGGWGRIPRAEALGQPKLELVAPARRAHPVASLVGHDPQQPRPEVSIEAEAIERPVRLDESLLRGVLRVGGRARDD